MFKFQNYLFTYITFAIDVRYMCKSHAANILPKMECHKHVVYTFTNILVGYKEI
jgi:hypothetical protein